jgi:hypothetical protein
MKIITGGQTGVDRAALDAAIEYGIEYSGWCPLGGWAEDLSEPPGLLARYPNLRDTPSADPAQRTKWNVHDSDATLIVIDGAGLGVSGGTRLARETATAHGNPCFIADLADPDAVKNARGWLTRVKPDALGIGGPRESEAPGIYERARVFLRALFAST